MRELLKKIVVSLSLLALVSVNIIVFSNKARADRWGCHAYDAEIYYDKPTGRCAVLVHYNCDDGTQETRMVAEC